MSVEIKSNNSLLKRICSIEIGIQIPSMIFPLFGIAKQSNWNFSVTDYVYRAQRDLTVLKELCHLGRSLNYENEIKKCKIQKWPNSVGKGNIKKGGTNIKKRRGNVIEVKHN